MRRVFALAFAVASLAVEPAAAQSRITIQQLRELCSATETSRQNLCGAYIAGVRQTMDVFKASLKDRVGYCIPATVTNRQVRDAFLTWAERNEAAATRAAISGVIRSIQEAYSCKRPGGDQFEF